MLALVGGFVFNPSPGQAQNPVIIAFGDSLTAGLGVKAKEAWPAVVQDKLAAKGVHITMVNAGVSGDTTAGGKARLAWSLDGGAAKPSAAIVALGANDALRALDPEDAFNNLDAILAELKKRRMNILLAGMLAPPNLGEDYGKRFLAIYTRLADKHDIALYPFLLDGVAADQNLNQADGIHPTAEGQQVIAQKILPWVEALLNGRTAAK